METLPNPNAKKNGREEAKKIYKLRSKTAELPFANIEQNMKVT